MNTIAIDLYAVTVGQAGAWRSSMSRGTPSDLSALQKSVELLVDLAQQAPDDLSRLTQLRSDVQAIDFHHVNVALLSILFGGRLGLEREQRVELGLSALVHASDGACALTDRQVSTHALPADERLELERATLTAVRRLLQEATPSTFALARVLTVYEHPHDLGLPIRDHADRSERTFPVSDAGVLARILSLCDAYDALTTRRASGAKLTSEQALLMLWTERRYKFDPTLLREFLAFRGVTPPEEPSGHAQNPRAAAR